MRRKAQSTLNEMCSKQDDSLPTFGTFNDSSERNDEACANGDSVSNTTTPRFRRHSSCSYVPRHAVNSGSETLSGEQAAQDVPNMASSSVLLNRRRKISVPNSPINEGRGDTPVSRDTTNTSNAFVGLNRRRKASLPSTMTLKPEQFLEGGKVEVAKREVDLDACMPVFTKEPAGSNKKQSASPLAKTEYNGWMFDQMEGKIAGNQGRLGRQRRISLPVLKVDGPDSQGCLNCDPVQGNQSAYLSATPAIPIPRVQSGPLVGKKAEMRQWVQRY